MLCAKCGNQVGNSLRMQLGKNGLITASYREAEKDEVVKAMREISLCRRAPGMLDVAAKLVHSCHFIMRMRYVSIHVRSTLEEMYQADDDVCCGFRRYPHCAR
jgi:hypothetical protein